MSITYRGLRCCFEFVWRYKHEVISQLYDVMNTSAIKCRITSKSTCSGDFGHGIYKGYSYNSSLYRNHEAFDQSVNDSPALRKHPIHDSFDDWQLVSLTSLLWRQRWNFVTSLFNEDLRWLINDHSWEYLKASVNIYLVNLVQWTTVTSIFLRL